MKFRLSPTGKGAWKTLARRLHRRAHKPMNGALFVSLAGVMLAGCGATSGSNGSTGRGTAATPTPFSSITWSASGPFAGDATGKIAVTHISAGPYVVHMTGCRRSATLTGGAASGNPFEGEQTTLYDGQTVNVAADGDYTVSTPDDVNLMCSWTLTLAPK